jgi:hypothetical protein
MQTGQSKADRDRYVDALVELVNSVRDAQVAQAQWKEGVSPVEDFIQRRIRTIAVGPMLLPHIWGYGICLPESIWKSEAMKNMIREICIGVAMWNDIYSLKKELDVMEMDNIVPILVHHHSISAQEAVGMVIEIINESYQKFCATVDCLRDAVDEEDRVVKRNLDVWVDACLDLLLGAIAWSTQVPRYLPRSAWTGVAGLDVVL